jgi:Ca-activated chloride channel family protein
MHDAIFDALRTQRADAQRQVVVVTDGLIGFEHQIVGRILTDLPESSRVHMVGVGHAANRALTGPAARAGGGVEVVVTPDEDVRSAVEILLSRTASPTLVNLTIDGAAEVAPRRFPDLFAGAPVRLSLALDDNPSTLTLSAKQRDGSTWTQTVFVHPPTAARHVSTRYAREVVLDLEADVAANLEVSAREARILALGLAHGISTRFTSWVAVSETATVDPNAPFRRVEIPQQLPAGMSAEGLGLRTVTNVAPGRRMLAQALSAPMPSPMPASSGAPARPRHTKSRKRKMGLFDRMKAVFEPFEPAPEEAKGMAPLAEKAKQVHRPGAAGQRAAPGHTAQVLSRSDGRLVLEIRAFQPFSGVQTVLATMPDGTTQELVVHKMPGKVETGQSFRITLLLGDGQPIPLSVQLGSLEVVIEF